MSACSQSPGGTGGGAGVKRSATGSKRMTGSAARPIRFLTGHFDRSCMTFRLEGSAPFRDIIECLPLAHK
jgi:hypothetical protein